MRSPGKSAVAELSSVFWVAKARSNGAASALRFNRDADLMSASRSSNNKLNPIEEEEYATDLQQGVQNPEHIQY